MGLQKTRKEFKLNNQDETERRLTPDSVNVDQTTTADNTDQNTDASANDTKNNANDKNNNRTISGYAFKFNTPSRPLGDGDNTFTEVIDPSALDGVDLSNVFMLNDHDFTQVLASTKAGTLKLSVDDVGLHYEATLPDTTIANDVLANIQAGNISDTSFAFAVGDDGDTFTKDDNGNVTRTIKHIKSLFDVSVCCIGAYDNGNDAVQVDTRSYEKWLKNENNQNKSEKRDKNMTEKTIIKPEKQENIEERSFEDYLRSAGERRDLQGLTTDNGKVVVPKEISTPILQLTQDKPTLANYITRRQVSSASGTLPVATRQNGTLKTKKELAEVPDVDAQLLQGVDYKLQTRIGRIYISEEEMEDSVIDLTSTIKQQLQQLVTNTDNENIVSILTGANNFQTANANLTANLDDIKKIKNTMLDPQLDVQVVISSTDFNTLDTMKDEKGNYLLQPSVTSPTGNSILTGANNFQTANANLTANLDDIKKIKNTMLDPQLDVQVVISSTDFNTLDTMKDEKGNYLLQPSVTSPTGKSLLGMDVIQMSDTLMKAGSMFIGSLAESVLEAYKGDY